MARLIDSSLQKLSSLMAEMGDLAIQCFSLAVESYLRGSDTTQQVYDMSNKIREKYHEVGELTFEMLLKYQPVADDFRMIRSSIEISYAFSRFGRYAYDITLIRKEFGEISECETEVIYEISNRTKQMIQDAVHSFAVLDVKKARQIQENEEFVDRLYRKRLPLLLKAKSTKCALAEALVLRYLERIGDHAMFMSDSINYIVTGKHRRE